MMKERKLKEEQAALALSQQQRAGPATINGVPNGERQIITDINQRPQDYATQGGTTLNTTQRL